MKTRVELPKLFSIVIIFTLFFVTVSTAKIASAQDSFFKGKTIQIIVGFTAGGGFDAYSRLIARHLGKHIPGNPNIIVQNMTGAGSAIAANHIFNVAKPDGLSIGCWNGYLVLGQLAGRKGISFDARKFQWIGSPMNSQIVIAFSKKSGIDSVEKWRSAKTPPSLGVTAPGSNLYDGPKIISAALNLPTKFVAGYQGFSEARLAMEGGEVDGVSPSWQGIKGTWSSAVSDIYLVIQTGSRPDPDIPDVPVAVELAETKEAKDLIRAGIDIPSSVNRGFSLPPNTPQDRVKILRTAYDKTLEDPDFKKDAQKSKLDIDSISGEEAQRVIASLFELDASVVEKLKNIVQ